MLKKLFLTALTAATIALSQTPHNANIDLLGHFDASVATWVAPFPPVITNPTGGCSNMNEIVINSTTGDLTGCINVASTLTWTLLNSGGGGGSSFGSLTSGTNTGMVGVCDTGCSLTASGGIIRATNMLGTGPYSVIGGTQTALAAPSAGNTSCWFDSVSTFQKCINPASDLATMIKVASCVSGDFTSGVDTNGNLICTTPVGGGTPSGTVSSALINQVAKYAASGTTVSGGYLTFTALLSMGTCPTDSTPESTWDAPATGTLAGVAGCLGTNLNQMYASFPNSGNPAVLKSFDLPPNFITTGGADVYLRYLTSTASGTFTMALDLVCTATDGTSTNDPTFTANNFFAPGAQTAPSTANRLQTVSTLAITWPAGCAANTMAHLRLIRTDTSGTAASVLVTGITVVGRRTL